MSAAWPRQMPIASWIIILLFGIITTSSHATAMNDAAEAAMPVTIALTGASWERSSLRIASPSHTDPPPELIRRSIRVTSLSSASRASATSLAEMPQ
jgi:hypothetical protein